MEDDYGMADLRQYMNGGRPIFGSTQQVLLSATSHQQQQHRILGPGHHQYDMVMGMAQVPITHHHQHHHNQHQHEFLTDSSTPPVAVGTATATGATTSAGFMDQMEAATGGGGGGGDGSARWPRQETLTLLEIRSRLDSKFKEANQKGPLWDEVSRIMSEEHGYQRTGKKCREKFENLYKYYKKTKEGKAGRQDGKHYRFFRQLEALYGETSNINNNMSSASASEARHQGSHFSYNPAVNNNNQDPHNFHHPYDSMSLSNHSSEELNTSSSDDMMMSLKGKIKEFIDGQMRKLMEKQEEWLERMMKMIEDKEQERILREEEWRNQETIRMEREQEFWAKERAWIEARDATLMEYIHKLSSSTSCIHNNEVDEKWHEGEVTRLIQLRTSMESRFQQLGMSSSSISSRNDHDDDDDVLWDEIGAKMGIMGFEKSGKMCKNKWDSIINKNKKRKENSTSLSSQCYNIDSNNNFQYYEADHGSSSSCLRYLMGDHHHQQHHHHHHHHQHHQNLWENYELKLSKGGGNGNL